MSCTIDKEKLTGWLDGELDAVERAEVERHISGCSECLRELDDLKSASAAVRGLARHPVPAGVTEKILHAVASPPARDPAVVPFRPRRTSWLAWATSAAAALFIGLNVVYFTQRTRVEDVPRQDTVIAQRPEPKQQARTEKSANDRKVESEHSIKEVDKHGEKSDEPMPQEDIVKSLQESREKNFGGRELKKAEAEPEKPGSAEPASTPYTVVSLDVADARERVERELRRLGVARVETGAGDADRSADAQDTCIEVELSEEQLAQLTARLNRESERLLWVPGIQGREDLARKFEELTRRREARALEEDSKDSAPVAKSEEKSKSAPPTNSAADRDEGGADKGSGSQRGGGKAPKKKIIIYFHEFDKKRK